MKPLSPATILQMEICNELRELRSIFDVCEQTIAADNPDDLLSTLDVLMSVNSRFQAFCRVESKYYDQLEDLGDKAVIRTSEETVERLAELYLIHAHFDVCATVVSSLKTDDLQSLSEVFMHAARRMYCLYDDQKNLNIKKEAA